MSISLGLKTPSNPIELLNAMLLHKAIIAVNTFIFLDAFLLIVSCSDERYTLKWTFQRNTALI
jgi:hypothetical protein